MFEKKEERKSFQGARTQPTHQNHFIAQTQGLLFLWKMRGHGDSKWSYRKIPEVKSSMPIKSTHARWACVRPLNARLMFVKFVCRHLTKILLFSPSNIMGKFRKPSNSNNLSRDSDRKLLRTQKVFLFFFLVHLTRNNVNVVCSWLAWLGFEIEVWYRVWAREVLCIRTWTARREQYSWLCRINKSDFFSLPQQSTLGATP